MTSQERVWKIASAVAVLLCVFLVALSIKEFKSIAYVGSNLQQSHTISVDGTGDAVAIPDIATISFSVTETAKTVSQAQSLATAKNNATIKALRDAGIAERDIQTTSYSINPHYEYQNGVCQANGSCLPSKSIVTGYDVSQGTQIKVRDLNKVGDLFTLIGSQGVQNVNGPSFSVDKPEGVEAEARSEAIAQAQAKAKVLADKLGVRLVRVISFSESGNGYPRPLMYGMGGDMVASKAEVAPTISTGEQKITSNVSIMYEIE